MAVADRPITDPMAAKASRTPPTLAASPSHSRPRTTAAQEVVIPQVGQRIPHRATSVQGGNPNCWCVPWPRGSGSNKQAMTNGTNRYPAVVAAKSRPRDVTSRRESPPAATPDFSDQALAWLQQTGSVALASRKGFTRARFNGGGRIAGSQTRDKIDSGADRPREQEAATTAGSIFVPVGQFLAIMSGEMRAGRLGRHAVGECRRSYSANRLRERLHEHSCCPPLRWLLIQMTARVTAKTASVARKVMAGNPGGQADEKNLPVRRSRIGKRRGHAEQNNTWHGQRTCRSAYPRLFPILRSRIFVHP